MRRLNSARSRLYKRRESRSKKNLLLTIFGIILIIAVAIKFGVPMIINFTLFVSGSKDFDQNAKIKDNSFIPAPFLNPMPSATNSAEIILSGVASSNQTINLYVNDALVDKVKAQKNGNFSFIHTLSENENTIRAKAETNGKESEFSLALNISYKKSPPSLNIASPTDGQSFSKDQNTVEVKGETDTQTKVTVNDFWAISDQSNKFSYILPLKNGENSIKIIAIDQAGNKTEKSIKVTYSP